MQRNRNRNRSASAVVVAFALVAAPALAQQLRQPPPPLPPPALPAQDASPRIVQPSAAPALPDHPSQRPANAPIRATAGDEKPQTAAAKQAQDDDDRQVIDASGRPVRGMVKVAPNRVRDTATGRYYWVSPAGRLLPDSGND